MADVLDCGIRVYDDDYVKFKYKQYCNLIKDKLRTHQTPHDRRYHQGFFVPTRPAKCINIMEMPEPTAIVYRSGWEKTFFEKCDSTDSILRWGSEIVKILYKNPIKNKMSFYVPDVYIEYLDKSKKLRKMLIEIKPMNQTKLREASNGYDRLQFAINTMKWASCIEFCKKRGIEFKVIGANELGVM